MQARRSFLKKATFAAFVLAQPGLLSCTRSGHKEDTTDAPWFRTRGIIISWDPSIDWARLAHEAGINVMSADPGPGMQSSPEWKRFLDDCRRYNIQLEHHQHAMGVFLPRDLFREDPSMFRMNEKGERVADYNCCAHSQRALDIIVENALKNMTAYPATSGRYFFWLDDGGSKCFCPQCSAYSDSDQALIIENAIIKAMRKKDPHSTLAHLAYQRTIPAPVKVKPEEGIFLQFAPFQRTWDFPITDPNAQRKGIDIRNAEYLKHLDDNLAVFAADTAEVLEYWLDVSLFSDWKKPAVKLPWKKDVFLADIGAYARRGIRNIVTFAVYVDQDYVKQYGDISFITEYGESLRNYTP